jgi:nicotinate phosphoribosyltransferase
MSRLAPETFRLPVEKIRSGYYSDSYFVLAKELLEAGGRHPGQGQGGGWRSGWPELRVRALSEGDRIEPWETVEAACGKPILFFPARHDHWLVQTGDGWGGARRRRKDGT